MGRMQVVTHFHNGLRAANSESDTADEFVLVTDSFDRDGISLLEEGGGALS
jgi:hypothetical protein